MVTGMGERGELKMGGGSEKKREKDKGRDTNVKEEGIVGLCPLQNLWRAMALLS